MTTISNKYLIQHISYFCSFSIISPPSLRPVNCSWWPSSGYKALSRFEGEGPPACSCMLSLEPVDASKIPNGWTEVPPSISAKRLKYWSYFLSISPQKTRGALPITDGRLTHCSVILMTILTFLHPPMGCRFISWPTQMSFTRRETHTCVNLRAGAHPQEWKHVPAFTTWPRLTRWLNAFSWQNCSHMNSCNSLFCTTFNSILWPTLLLNHGSAGWWNIKQALDSIKGLDCSIRAQSSEFVLGFMYLYPF